MRSLKVIVEKHADGYVAYPIKRFIVFHGMRHPAQMR